MMLLPPRYQVGLDRPVTQTYKDLLTKLPGGSTVLENAYSVIEKTISCVEWLRMQPPPPRQSPAAAPRTRPSRGPGRWG